MRQSKINPKFEYNEAKWVVSVLNTTGSLIDGHAAIVVEGIENDHFSLNKKVFIGQYDISANSEEGGLINPQGYITKIKCYENEENKRDYESKRYPSQSYYITRLAAWKMVASIKADRARTEQAMENWARNSRNLKKGEHEQKESFILDLDGKPIEPISYQKLGKHHPFVKLLLDPEQGDNCAGWCLEKLAIAGIGDGTGIPKPKVISGQCLLC